MSTTEQDLIGLIPRTIVQGYDDLIIEFEDGSRARWYHRQDCCESVQIEEVIGDLDDLIGHPLLVCECRTNHEDNTENFDSATWTFYEFRSIGGSVTVRWLGISNGYYSESVDFEFNRGES